MGLRIHGFPNIVGREVGCGEKEKQKEEENKM